MARNRKKKALYEVIGKTWPKPGSGRAVEQLHPEKPHRDESVAAKSAMPVPEKASQWPRRPRMLRFNADRVEISMPYQLAIALLLGIVLLVLGAFRLGQYLREQKAIDSGPEIENTGLKKPPGPTTVDAPATADETGETESTGPTGDNAIVLVQFGRHADLWPVQQHFAEYGIETEIMKENGEYFLVTKDRYESVDRPGTAGYEAKQKIIAVGALYKGKAPDGYETFAPHYFRDAYGKKVK